MSTQDIRLFGDPVLTQRAREVTEVDGALARLSSAMVDTMYAAPGAGLAAPQVGVQRRMFVYDIGDGPQTIVNPEVVETRDTWTFEEGCLSVPGVFFDIERPKVVTITGLDLDGREIVLEGDELLGRVFLHEMDHLDGVLLFDRLEPDRRKVALRELREQVMVPRAPSDAHGVL
ncbi:MAG: peptide deformylase [Acidimicrobiia bacterium]